MPRRGKLTRKVCRNCKAILNPDVKQCPFCGSTDLTEDYSGFIIVVDPEKSELAKKKGLKEGMWAIKVF